MYQRKDNTVCVGGLRILPRTIQVVVGKQDAGAAQIEGDRLLLCIAAAVDSGDSLAFMLDPVIRAFEESDDESRRRARMALVRVQVDSEVRRQEDIQANQLRKYAAEVLERLLFGGLFLEMRRENHDPEGPEYERQPTSLSCGGCNTC